MLTPISTAMYLTKKLNGCCNIVLYLALYHPDAEQPLQDFRHLVEKGSYANFAGLKATFASVDKVGDKFAFNIGGNKYRLIAAVAFKPALMWVKAVLTHAQYDKGDWQ